MIEPSFLELTPSSTSTKPSSCGNYDNPLNENHHQSLINFHDLDQKTYSEKVMDSNSSPSFPEPLQTAEVKNGYLNGAPTVTDHNITSPSGLVTPPILPGTTTANNTDNQRALLENVASRLATSVDQSEVAPIVKQEPEFPPSRFDLPKELSTPTLPDKLTDHDTPSTVSPPASLPVAATTSTGCVTSAAKREEENGLSPMYDDAEYAAAAIAAVDSVVSALVGNKAPSTSAPYDPALIGTGTDRLYSLSLAPVGKIEAVSLVDSTISASTPTVQPCTHAILLTSLTQASAEGLSSLSCPNCGAVVSVQQLILQRQRSAAEAKHVCEACGKCFVREDKLKRHIMSIHTQEKPHVCSICTKAFARK
ncbi:unnamed protein product [Rodentolepis nana]|uniref:C2H2-type domain-containing protein n=1 Tax=Rodentolepis nana TaxID=102285 RepID=A0A0R3TNY7_RODNA|nr:unnamed protein product [Rodentolepis nana]